MPDISTPPPARRFQPVPVEETVKKVRRFAPEPVETTTRSSKRDNGGTAVERNDNAGKRRLVPVPVEISFKSSKLDKAGQSLPSPEPSPQSPPPEETPKPRRRFVPELIETTKRSKRAGDSRPATLPTDKVYIHISTYAWPLLIVMSILDGSNPWSPKHIHVPAQVKRSPSCGRHRGGILWCTSSDRAIRTSKTAINAPT